MRLDDERESSNIEDQRGMSFGGGGVGGGGLGGLLGLIFAARGLGIGIPGLLIIGALYLFFSGGLGGGGSRAPSGFQPGASATAPTQRGAESQTDVFVRKVLASTEDTWTKIFQANGLQYRYPKLVFYSGQGRSGCGAAQAAMGPFYCPSDQKIYLDESFFQEMRNRFGVNGDFANAYVIAHEVGHHVQKLTSQYAKAQATGLPEAGSGGQQVRIELQADCYAGVWGADHRDILDPGDVDEALRAANAIGDDTLQRESTGRVAPDSFTHGTSAQRMRWFKKGYESGDPAACDTYSAQEV
ncbi:MAG: neutral zinc metallopeptidase [Sphingomonadaceae bacterium]|nr:neutral zinc metallopeptidase [Sphingomonadaceae bacterium]